MFFCFFLCFTAGHNSQYNLQMNHSVTSSSGLVSQVQEGYKELNIDVTGWASSTADSNHSLLQAYHLVCFGWPNLILLEKYFPNKATHIWTQNGNGTDFGPSPHKANSQSITHPSRQSCISVSIALHTHAVSLYILWMAKVSHSVWRLAAMCQIHTKSVPQTCRCSACSVTASPDFSLVPAFPDKMPSPAFCTSA